MGNLMGWENCTYLMGLTSMEHSKKCLKVRVDLSLKTVFTMREKWKEELPMEKESQSIT